MDQITPKSEPSAEVRDRPRLPGQVVLVFQGGGALGAYQGGVYQALHEAGIEPDWVVGTSIGALNGALIVGNDVAWRLSGCGNFGGGSSRNRCGAKRRLGRRSGAVRLI